MKKVMIVFGTRPEAIKMCPLIIELSKQTHIKTVVCVTGQHRQMLDQVLNIFNISPDIDLDIMKPTQTLFDLTVKILEKMNNVLETTKPDLVLVHGDTTTSFVTSLACFYLKIPVGHVEAGLRTFNLTNPFPEEFNRKATSIIAKYHFAPTKQAYDNLVNEGINPQSIFVTGNTVIDALHTTIRQNYHHPFFDWVSSSRLIILTVHRRENIGQPLVNILQAISKIIKEHDDIKVIYPVHPNPEIKNIVDDFFKGDDHIKIVEPFSVVDFHNILNKSYLVITDSGGIQEEAPSLNKPVLVVRNHTERPECVLAGSIKLVGTNKKTIYENIKLLIENQEVYQNMTNNTYPYGNGDASQKIVEIISRELHSDYSD